MYKIKTYLKNNKKEIAKAGALLTVCCVGSFIGAIIGTKSELSNSQFEINLISSTGKN